MRTEAPITPLPIPPGDTRPIIVFGGSFDPPHRAHVDLPVAARAAALPDAWLLYVPASRSPLKPAPGASDADRLAMLRLALEGVERVAVWTDELDRAAWHSARGSAAPSYTVDTVTRLQRIAPPGTVLRVLIGADQAVDLHRWREPRAIVKAAPPLVLPRAPVIDKAVFTTALRATSAWTEDEVKTLAGGLIAAAGVLPPSSTVVRCAIEQGELARAATHLQPAVARYIADRSLYGPVAS